MFKVINGGKLPTRGSKYSACVDLYANEDIVIGAGETVKVGLGVAIDMDRYCQQMHNANYKDIVLGKQNQPNIFYSVHSFMKSHYLQLNPRSSLRAKGLISHTGIIDLDYKDEIKIIIHNPLELTHFQNDVSSKMYKINKGERIAQVTLIEHKGYLFGIDTEDERDGGIGSTGA
jgi:dUTPase